MAGYLGREACDKDPFAFISYNTEDQQRISMIVSQLPQALNIWYDKGLKRVSHEEWQEQIAAHIRSAEIVFFFISKGIFAKLDSFVRKEYDIARRHNKQICIVMLDRITTDMVPAKYDFWWGELQSKQCIQAGGLTPAQTAAHIAEECLELDAFARAAQQAAQAVQQAAQIPDRAPVYQPVPPQHPAPAPKRSFSPLPFIGLGLTVIGAPLFPFPGIAVPLCIAGLVISVIGCVKHCRLYGLSIAGILLSVLALIWMLLAFILGAYSGHNDTAADTPAVPDSAVTAVYEDDSDEETAEEEADDSSRSDDAFAPIEQSDVSITAEADFNGD